MLQIQVRRQLGSFALEAALTVPAAGVTVVVGESGSGKTTLLRLVAGLLEPDHGSITLDGAVLTDTTTGHFAPPEARPVGYVAQDYALFPHLSAGENIGFGLRALGRPAAEIRDRVAHALDRFGLAGLGARWPSQLSGGQQQRVALARALVLDPAVLLLDEPLAALDPPTRRSVRGELRRTLEGLSCATLFVTHQPAEALAFGEQIVVLEAGRISQAGSRSDFLRQPRSRYVAEFLGVNWLEGEIIARPADGLVTVAVGDGTLVVPDPGHDGRARLVVHPHDIVISVEAPAGSARNVLRGLVEELIPEPPNGERLRLLLSTKPALAAQITQSAAASMGLRPGTEIFASFKATAVVVLGA